MPIATTSGPECSRNPTLQPSSEGVGLPGLPVVPHAPARGGRVHRLHVFHVRRKERVLRLHGVRVPPDGEQGMDGLHLREVRQKGRPPSALGLLRWHPGHEGPRPRPTLAQILRRQRIENRVTLSISSRGANPIGSICFCRVSVKTLGSWDKALRKPNTPRGRPGCHPPALDRLVCMRSRFGLSQSCV